MVMKENINKKIGQATKWSTVTEIATKLVSPITNAILARLLVPEAFGVVATLVMITSFAEIFTDAGFQKYLVQHDMGVLQCVLCAFYSGCAGAGEAVKGGIAGSFTDWWRKSAFGGVFVLLSGLV